MKIKDGTGSGNEAKVNSDNRLAVESVSETDLANVSREEGQAYVISHAGFITISSTGTETGILHIKNTSTTKQFEIHAIRTCGNVIQKWKLYKNSNAGTLITDQTAGNVNNLNIASANSADLTVYRGANAKTVSGGTMIGHHINDVGHAEDMFEGALILGTNDSIQLSVEVASAGDICCRVIGHFK